MFEMLQEFLYIVGPLHLLFDPHGVFVYVSAEFYYTVPLKPAALYITV